MRTLICLVTALLVIVIASVNLHAAPVKTYSFAAAAFVEDPTSSWIYAAVPSLNSVEIINAHTLQVAQTVVIGASPSVLALSSDGSTLYIGGSGSNNIFRLNTATLATLAPLTAPAGTPVSMQIGTNNRLWVLSGNNIHQIDATTGASTGPDLTTANGMYPLLVNGGEISVTPNGNSLYYANTGYSPSNAYRYDISGPTAQEQWAYSAGGNGRTLAVSNDGTKFAYASAGDDHGHVAVNSTIDTHQLGLLSEPVTDLTFSADDNAIFGTFTYLRYIDQYNANTYQLLSTSMTLAGDGEVLFSDKSNTRLFVGESNGTEVFAISTPEPAAALLMTPLAALFLRRKKR